MPRPGPLPKGGAVVRWPSPLTLWLPEPWPEAPQGRCHISVPSPLGFAKTTTGMRHNQGSQTQSREFQHPLRNRHCRECRKQGGLGKQLGQSAEASGTVGTGCCPLTCEAGAVEAPPLQTAGLPFVKLPLHTHDHVAPSNHLCLLCSSFIYCKKRRGHMATPVCLMEVMLSMHRRRNLSAS